MGAKRLWQNHLTKKFDVSYLLVFIWSGTVPNTVDKLWSKEKWRVWTVWQTQQVVLWSKNNGWHFLTKAVNVWIMCYWVIWIPDQTRLVVSRMSSNSLCPGLYMWLHICCIFSRELRHSMSSSSSIILVGQSLGVVCALVLNSQSATLPAHWPKHAAACPDN